MTAPILITEAPKGTPATKAPVRTRRDLKTVAIVAPPGPRAHFDMPLDILTQLGVRHDVSGRSSHLQNDMTRVPLWLRAHETEWLVVTSPHVLSVPAMQLLATLTIPVATTLLMVCDHAQAVPVREGLADYNASALDWDKISEDVPPIDTVQADPPTPAPVSWSSDDMTLPREDWPRFRSECRRLLHPRTFETVDAEYVRAFQQARAWLRQNQPAEQATADLVGRIVGVTANVDQATTAIRACQAAHAQAGWMLRMNLDKALTAISERPATFTDAEWRLLRAYRDPHRSCAIALHQHDMSATQIHELALEDIAADGSTAAGVPIMVQAQPFVRAQRLTLDPPLR